MPKIKSSEELTKFIPLPAGVHILTLAKVEERESANIFADRAEDGTYLDTGTDTPPMRPQLLWVFESDELRPDGEPYAYAYWTGLYYGDDRAKLTAFLNSILPDSTHDERKNVDTDALIGARFRVRIATTKNKAGKDRPMHTLIEPAPSAETPKVAPRPTPAMVGSPVDETTKGAIDSALNAAAAAEGQAPLKTRLLAELGRLRYASYRDFIERGDHYGAAILKFITNAVEDDGMPW